MPKAAFHWMRHGDAALFRSACHELRNPLHAILAMLDFLVEDRTLKSQQLQDVITMQVCAFNMQRLVNDVLDLAKLREGKLAIQPVMVGGEPERCSLASNIQVGVSESVRIQSPGPVSRTK